MLSFMSAVASRCGKKITPKEVQKIVTIRDALNLLD